MQQAQVFKNFTNTLIKRGVSIGFAMFLLILYLAIVSLCNSGINGKSVDLTKKLHEGHLTSIKNFPYTVAVVGPHDHISSGFIYNQRTIITSGSWLNMFSESNIDIITGDNVTSKGIRRIVSHPDFARNGLAIVCLKQRLRYTENTKEAEVSTSWYPGDKEAYVSGWEISKNETDRRKYVFKFAKETIEDPTNCKRIKASFNDTAEICTQTYLHVHCKDDYGTPLAVNGKIVGIYKGSEYADCDKANTYFYTTIRSYMDFIRSNDCNST